MSPVHFPPVEEATEEGLIGVGGDLTPDTLVAAYSQGIFPWPISPEYPLTWFSPDPRGILFVDELHCSRSFKKFLKNHPYTIRFNSNFEAVIRACQQATRPQQVSTWITNQMLKAYIKLFEANHAFSVEIYDEDELVGGLYGVKVGQYYAGESMFHLKDNASKLALYSLMMKLKEEAIPWLDTQMITEVTESLGAKEVPRAYYMMLLAKQINKETIRKSNFP